MPADEKPKKQPPGPPSKPAAKPVTSNRPALKRAPPVPGYSNDDDDVTVMHTDPGHAPRKATVTNVPIAKPQATQARAKAPAEKPGPPVPGSSYPTGLTPIQKRQMDSGFLDGVNERKRTAALGTLTEAFNIADLTRAMPSAPGAPAVTYTGEIPAPQVADDNAWKAVAAPVQSRPGSRSKESLEQVIKQFAVATNTRYRNDAAGKPRGHIFVWDVSRAMGCEIPHFVGAQELTLGATINWIRHEGPMRGWLRTGEYDVYDTVCAGKLVIALPRDVKTRTLGIVVPDEPGDDGKPLLAAACLQFGYGVHPSKALGVRLVDYFHHP